MTQDEIKDLGRKARERRAEEISKRKEVVLLESPLVAEQDDTTTTAKKKKGSISIRPKKRTTSPAKRPPRLSSDPSQNSKRPRIGTKRGRDETPEERDPNVDTRIPDISHLVLSSDKAEGHIGSNTVRVHGLPVEARPADLLLRFFAGLEPIEVFVLPTNRSHILGWDAIESSVRSGSLERHPTSFRVFVKFANAPAASLAAQRSGEVIYIGKSTDAPTPRKGATIAITQIPKGTARYLQQNMSITCRANEPIQQTLQNCEEKLHDLVPKIVWTAALQDLGLCASTETQRFWKELQYKPLLREVISRIDPSSSSSSSQGYDALVEIHNTLVQDYEALAYQIPFPAIALGSSPDLLRHPAIRLSDSACKQLRNMSKQLEGYLHMVRTITDPAQGPRGVFERLIQKETSRILDDD